MSNPLKAIAKGIKNIVKGVKKVFKKVGKAIKSVFSSSLGKAILIGAGLFFGIPAAAGALGIGASGASTAGAWWSSTFGATAGSAGNLAGGMATGQVIGTTGTAAGAAAGATGAAAGTSGGGLLGAGLPAGTTMGGAASGFGSAAAGGASAAASGTALGAAVGSVAGGVGKLAKGAASAFGKLSPTTQAAVVNMAGQGIAGHYEQKAAQEEQDRLWQREDEVYNRGGSWGLGNDGRQVSPPVRAEGGYRPRIDSPTGLLAQTNQRSTGFNEQEEAERLWEEMSPAERIQVQRTMSANRFG